jgi:methylthioribulose-1-phosphate dehydratase
MSICSREHGHIYLAPTGVQKELISPSDIFVLPASNTSVRDPKTGARISHHDLPYVRWPRPLNPSACTPLFLAAFRLREAGCAIHTHSQWAVLVTLLLERDAVSATGNPNASPDVFEIERIEQIKGIPQGPGKKGNMGFFDRLRIPIIENTAKEEDLTESLERAMQEWPDTYAVLVRRHGIYVWGEDVARAKTICESLDWIFRLAVEMRGLGLQWTGSEA